MVGSRTRTGSELCANLKQMLLRFLTLTSRYQCGDTSLPQLELCISQNPNSLYVGDRGHKLCQTAQKATALASLLVGAQLDMVRAHPLGSA